MNDILKTIDILRVAANDDELLAILAVDDVKRAEHRARAAANRQLLIEAEHAAKSQARV